VESKRLFLNNFAINASSQSSDTLKNAIIINIIKTIIAIIIPRAFDQDLEVALKSVKDIATQTARINNCIIEIFIGHIWNDIPLKSHFLIFFG
jgi:hypothetical protein